jgi:hypothetical protein
LKNDATRTYLMKIAEAVERWPRMLKDSAELAIAVATPAGAMRCTASTILDVGERAAVLAALPVIVTDNFATAAHQIREAVSGA